MRLEREVKRYPWHKKVRIFLRTQVVVYCVTFSETMGGGVSAAQKGAQKGCPKGKVISKEDKEKKEEICIMHRRVMEKLSFFAKRR